jgi:hypothetical protein
MNEEPIRAEDQQTQARHAFAVAPMLPQKPTNSVQYFGDT